jgi:preprotein translocase subunit SecD
MAFFLDGEPIRGEDDRIVAPLVRGQISDQGVIEGLSASDARTLATLLRTGAFPVPLRVVQQEDVDATLGDQAVVHSVQAGLVAIFVVMAFMVLYYRLPGVLASAALFVYVSLTLAVFKLWPVTITSAGMAAFVLSVGMAVDANILIFERMKEELRLGRSLVGAIDAGFARAWTSIRDSNISTLITCVILYWFGDQFGASLVKGFALTLALGVMMSMFSAITVTRTFLHVLVGTPVMRHLWLFGSDVEAARRLMPAGGAVVRGQSPRSREP